MDDFRGIASFPEAICIVPVVLLGWGPALILMVSAERSIAPYDHAHRASRDE